MNEHLEFICPLCGVQVNVEKSQAGERVDCPRCSEKIVVPGVKSSIDDMFADIFDEPAPSENPPSAPPSESPQAPAEPASVAESTMSDLSLADLDLQTDALDDVSTNENAETTASVEPGPTATPQTMAAGDQDVDELLPVDLGSDDEFPVMKNLDQSPRHKDPFKDRTEPKIRIDGVEGDYGSDMISIICPICESRVYAQRSSAGAKIKCDDCYSEVDVPTLDEWDQENADDAKKLQKTELTFSGSDETGDLKLGDPIETPKIDYNVNDEYGLEPVDNDLLAPKAPASPIVDPTMAPAHPIESELFQSGTAEGSNPAPEQPMSAIPVDSPLAPDAKDSQEDGYDLLPLDDDPPSDKKEPATSQPSGTAIPTPASTTQQPTEQAATEKMTPENPAPTTPDHRDPAMHPSTEDAESDAQSGAKDSTSSNLDKEQERVTELGEELKSLATTIAFTFKNLDGLLIVSIFSGILAIGLGLITIGTHYMASDTRVVSVVGYFPYALGAFMWLVSLLLEGIILYNAMLSGIYKKKDSAEWPEFNFSEMFGQFLNVGLANIISCLPGLMAWATLAALGGVFVYLAPFFMVTSRLLLGPPMMMSAMKNQSFYKFYSPTIFQSPKKAAREWLIFYGLLACIGIFLIVFQSLTLVGFCVASGIFGIIYGVFMLVYGTMIGYHFDRVLRKMGETEMLAEGV